MVPVDEALGEGSPGLGVQRRVVEQTGLAGDVLRRVASVPLRGQRPRQPRAEAPLQQLAFATPLGVSQRPHRGHALAVDQHHGRVLRRQGEVAVLGEGKIEELSWIAEVDLVAVVVEGASPPTGVVRHGEAVAAEAGGPEPAAVAPQLLHQVDLVGATRVANPLDRPEQHPLGALLSRLAAHEDAHGIPATAARSRPRRQQDALGPLALESQSTCPPGRTVHSWTACHQATEARSASPGPRLRLRPPREPG